LVVVEVFTDTGREAKNTKRETAHILTGENTNINTELDATLHLKYAS